MVKERNSSFELMRIISMFMIVFWHLFRCGNVLLNCNDNLSIIFIFIQSLFCVHVNSFVLLSGYFQCTNKMKLSKVISINNSIWFYKALIPILLIAINQLEPLRLSIMVKKISPISHFDYWFMTTYLLLYLISPILNTVIENVNQKKHKNIIILLFVLLSVLPTITGQAFYDNRCGYSLGNFILLYFIGSYFRKYPVEKNKIFSLVSNNCRSLIFLFSFLFLAFIQSMIQISGLSFLKMNSWINEIGVIFNKSFTSYDNPLLIIQTICYFLFFSTLCFKSKFINKIAGTCLGIYLIHDNEYLIMKIHEWFNLNEVRIHSSRFVIKLFLLTIIVFICCSIIEYIRQLLFKFIYKRKISKKIREKFYRYIDSLKSN